MDQDINHKPFSDNAGFIQIILTRFKNSVQLPINIIFYHYSLINIPASDFPILRDSLSSTELWLCGYHI